MANGLMREYETIYVMRPELDDKEAKELMLAKKALIEELGGKNVKVTAMGRRKLQWETKKETRGIFVHHQFLGLSGIVKDFDRDLSIDDRILIRQSVLLKQDVDPNLVKIEEDILVPPVFKEKRESYERRSNFDDREGYWQNDRDFGYEQSNKNQSRDSQNIGDDDFNQSESEDN